MYGCESWIIKKAGHWKIDAFELWCWRRLLRVLWTARRSIQSILKEISPECSLEGLMLKLKFQYFGHLCQELAHWKRPWCWEWLKTGGEGDNRGWHGWIASLTWWTWVWASSESWWWTGKAGVLWSIGSQRVRHDWATELNWTETYAVHSLGQLLNKHPCVEYASFMAQLYKISTKCQGLIPGFTLDVALALLELSEQEVDDLLPLEHEKFLKHKFLVQEILLALRIDKDPIVHSKAMSSFAHDLESSATSPLDSMKAFLDNTPAVSGVDSHRRVLRKIQQKRISWWCWGTGLVMRRPTSRNLQSSS